MGVGGAGDHVAARNAISHKSIPVMPPAVRATGRAMYTADQVRSTAAACWLTLGGPKVLDNLSVCCRS